MAYPRPRFEIQVLVPCPGLFPPMRCWLDVEGKRHLENKVSDSLSTHTPNHVPNDFQTPRTSKYVHSLKETQRLCRKQNPIYLLILFSFLPP